MKRSEVDREKVSPMMKHYLELKDKYEDIIIFYRLGDFYEMFFDDALVGSKELELTLTGRNAGLDERVPMCGVPYHAKDIYIEKLVNKGYKVAICEQLSEPNAGKGVVDRDIIQVVSSGTIINNNLNEKENNYIGNIYDFGYCYGLAIADISTGEIYTYLILRDKEQLLYEIIDNNVKELIVTSSIDKDLIQRVRSEYNIIVTILDDVLESVKYKYIYEQLKDVRYQKTIMHLLYYMCNNSKREITHMQKAVIKNKDDYLKMDIHTKRNLELTENIRLKERNYSLLWLLDFTKTAMGGRKLKNYIENPIVNKNVLEKRYDIVENLLKEFILCEELREKISEVYDLERLCGRISFGNTNARDLLQLKQSLKVLPDIQKILTEIGFYDNVVLLSNLYELLEKSIYEDPPISIKEGNLIKKGYSLELDELKSLRSGGKDFISKFELEEKTRTGIKNLKIGFNKVFGYYIEISKGNISLITDEMGYIRKQTLANCERYITPILKEKEDLIMSAEEKIINLEYELFNQIREKVKTFITVIQENSKVISEIDVLQSFARASEKYNYVRPIITLENNIEVVDSRHPVVENVIKGEYVRNDIIMDKNTHVLLITGPNMSGKSTYMRQLGIIVIMAQIGCFVPAKRAVLPVFDKIFTRIGASDDLVSGESTFMVEMLEASNTIINATDRSLILFDELGRGTATFDGMSLAQAILEYIHDKIGAKTLFSTHYHELTDLENNLQYLKNKHVSVVEEDGNVTFLHKIEDGSVDKSYGINVAKLAKLPDEVIKRASQILNVYEGKEKKKDFVIQTMLPLDFEDKKNEIEEEIKKLNILEMTPLDALNYLSILKEKIKK